MCEMRAAAQRYGLAALLVLASVLFCLLLQRWVGASGPYLPFFPAILAAAWYGGFGPGLAATLASGAAAFFVVAAPGPSHPGEKLLSLGLFLLTGTGIAWFNHRLRLAEAARRDEVALGSARAQELDTILSTAVDGIIVIDERGRIESFNGGAERLFGHARDQVIGRNVSVLMPPPDRQQHDGYLANYLTTGQGSIIGVGRQVTGLRRDGTTFPLYLSVGEMTVAGVRKFTGMLHDLTARKEAEERQRISDARWHAVAESAVDGMVVIDARGHIEAFNPAAERLFGYAEQDVVGKNVNVLMPSPYREQHDAYLARYLTTGEKKIIGLGREVIGLRRDGSTFPVHLSVGEMSGQGDRKFVGILHDLTARTAVEQQLREQTALARLGEMAAVVAHEVKNPLAGIRGAIQIIGGRLPPGTDASIIKEIIGRIDALGELMAGLLLFARPPAPRVGPVDVNALVAVTAELLSKDPTLRDLEVHVEGYAPAVTADPSLLQIVFHNLLVNGAHAMHGKGRLRVSIGQVDSTCRVTFADSGPGIPAEVREKIFMPFFTTKARGSGLGLPTSKRLIEAHHGRLIVECPPAGGTSVTVQLPLSPAPDPSPSA
jgi:two-component system, LuxR family, sensor kinase FixL